METNSYGVFEKVLLEILQEFVLQVFSNKLAREVCVGEMDVGMCS